MLASWARTVKRLSYRPSRGQANERYRFTQRAG